MVSSPYKSFDPHEDSALLSLLAINVVKNTSIQFIERKLLLILNEPDLMTPPSLDANRDYNNSIMFIEPLDRIKRSGKASVRALRDMDSMIEDLLLPCIGKRAIATINSKLTAEFGFCRLSIDPVAVAERILKRSRIQNSAEGEIAKELVADQRTIDRIGATNYKQLAILLDKWERQ